jgi:hypothetical protein
MKGIYLEAARRVAVRREWYSCNAVDAAARVGNSRARRLYRDIFGEEDGGSYFLHTSQFELDGNGNEHTLQEARDLRVLALCFMAAACDDLREGA